MFPDPESRKRYIGLESTYSDLYPVQVRGESSYHGNLEKICGYFDEDEGYDDNSHQAALYLEDDNPVDKNAVRVEIDDLTVGYLSKADALTYRKRLKEIDTPENAIAICVASIKGGFAKRDGEMANFGVRLDFELDAFTLTPVRWTDDSKKQNPISVAEPAKQVIEPKADKGFFSRPVGKVLVGCIAAVVGLCLFLACIIAAGQIAG